MRLDPEVVVAAIESVLPERRPIAHHEPCIDGAESNQVIQCLNDEPCGYKHIHLMEGKLRDLTQQYCLLVSSGTAALELVLRSVGIGAGDEVLVPALTFVGTANAVSHTGAVPNFIDSTPYQINAFKLRRYLERTTKKDEWSQCINAKTERPIKAIIAVDLMGIPCNIKEIQAIADQYRLLLIEDAAEALGSINGNQACGSFGNAGILSFNCNKIVTTGGGGAIISSDEWIMAKSLQLATTARLTHPWKVEHDAIAWNYRLPNIAAAMGYGQILKLATFLNLKRVLYSRYQEVLKGIKGLESIEHPEGSNCWLNGLLVHNRKDRDVLLKALHDKQILARAIFTPLHKLPMYKDHPQDNLGYAEDIAARLICLPSGVRLAYESAVY